MDATIYNFFIFVLFVIAVFPYRVSILDFQPKIVYFSLISGNGCFSNAIRKRRCKDLIVDELK